jgi:hypothetical protein
MVFLILHNDLVHSTSGTVDIAKTSNPPSPIIHCQCPLHNPANAMREDCARVLSYMEEYQQRIDRLTSVVTAIISIGDSRTSQADNQNVAWLTWLATFFIPMSFVTGLFSMTEEGECICRVVESQAHCTQKVQGADIEHEAPRTCMCNEHQFNF